MSETRAIRALQEMVELCLAAGVSPRHIMAAVGLVFSAMPPASPPSRWPRSRLGGWSDESRPEPDKVAAKAADVMTIFDEIKGS